MKYTLQSRINQINGALTDLGERKAYDIKYPSYNYRGYCFRRIAACVQALDLMPPEDVPCWDFWAETWYDTGSYGSLFWKLWAWNRNQQGELECDLETHMDDCLNLLCTIEPEWNVCYQASALKKLKSKRPYFAPWDCKIKTYDV